MGGAADDLPNITPTVFHRHEPFCSDSASSADTFKGALEVGAHKCQKLNNFANMQTEVMQWSRQSSTEEEKKVLLDLAFTWMQAAR